ncbi:P-loop containing nucleoside triphosphate hydrolase protein [Mycena vulgaris]|nr:P-loop containing nucleoside triphosphate hydrolase protein [Mycena vulgaris]
MNGPGLLRNAAASSERFVVRQRRNPNPHRTDIALTTDIRRFCRQRCFSSVPSAREQEDILFADAVPHSPVSRPQRYLQRSANDSAAEREWLQKDVELLSIETIQSSPRFDWRFIAPSRIRNPPPPQPKSDRKTRYMRRMQPPRIDVGWNEPYYDAIQTYSKRFLAMLEAEQQEDESVLKERLSTWSLTRLEEEGYCLTGMSAYWLQENQFGRPVASFLQGPGLALPEHRFENGTQVLLSRIDPLQESFAQGSVVSTSTSQIRIAFRDHFDELDAGAWRIDVGRTNIAYERMRDAIGHLNHDPQKLEAAAMSADRELILQGTHLRDILLRTSQPASGSSLGRQSEMWPEATESALVADEGAVLEAQPSASDTDGAFKDDQRIRSWARRYSLSKPLIMEGDPTLEGLNTTQIRAMALMIGQQVSLVQGPPGTGKTKTIIETIKLLKVHFEVPQPLLVCTYTNVAVDNLVEGLAASGVKPLRVGFAGKVKSSLVEHTLDYKLECHPLKPSLDALAKQEEAVSQRIRDLSKKLTDIKKSKTGTSANAQERKRQIIANMEADLAVRQRIQTSLKARMYALEMRMLRDVVSKADVICTTCITSASAALNVVDFPVVFLDEASMSTEPASLIPIMKGSRHLALIGDHKQLPPVITSPEAQALGLGRSLFERLTEEAVVPTIMLDTQYRMHPGISLFPSTEFYNFSLQDGTVDANNEVFPILTPPSSAHLKEDENGNRPAVIFLDHAGGESMKDKSRVNQNEAAIVIGVVEDLLLNNPNLQGKDIGIIAPYVAQISLLTRMLNTNVKYRKRFNAVLGEHRALQLAHIEIKTVDGFEGREKEIIIFSTVRNNAGGYIGFLADRRRLNVGLTRAKRGLFVVGSISTLGKGVRAASKAPQAPVEATAGAEVEGAPLVVQPGEIKVIEAKEAKVLKLTTAKGKRHSHDKDSWKRYAQWLTDRGLVIQLGGDSLGQALYGNLQRAAVKKRTLS